MDNKEKGPIEILDEICSSTMVEWDLNKFRKSHSTLLFCIEVAMNYYADEINKRKK